MTFNDVKGAFCRIYEDKTKAEFVKYDLQENHDNISTGCIIASLGRNEDSWALKARGYFVKEIRLGTGMLKTCQEVL